MDLSQTAIRVIILVIPGVIFNKVFNQLVGKKAKKDWEEFFEIIFISIICYLIMSISVSTDITYNFRLVDNLKALYTDSIIPNFFEVVFASLVGVLLAYILCWVNKKNFINKIANKFGVSYRYGDEDLWEKFFKEESNKYLTIRDYKTKLYYYGVIALYSETEKTRELVITDVSVFNEDGDFCYDIEKLYINRSFDDISIEFSGQITEEEVI